jgi:hypothetical protein
MMIMSTVYKSNAISWTLYRAILPKQQLAGKRATWTQYIDSEPNSIWSYSIKLRGYRRISIYQFYIVFSLTRPGCVPTIYHTSTLTITPLMWYLSICIPTKLNLLLEPNVHSTSLVTRPP